MNIIISNIDNNIEMFINVKKYNQHGWNDRNDYTKDKY
jgi:hypothetical protein